MHTILFYFLFKISKALHWHTPYGRLPTASDPNPRNRENTDIGCTLCVQNDGVSTSVPSLHRSVSLLPLIGRSAQALKQILLLLLRSANIMIRNPVLARKPWYKQYYDYYGPPFHGFGTWYASDAVRKRTCTIPTKSFISNVYTAK